MRTLSVLTSCTGGYVGSGHVHPAVVDAVRRAAAEVKGTGAVTDAFTARCGDDLALIVLHDGPPGSPAIRRIAYEAFVSSGAVATELGQHNATNGSPRIEEVELAFMPRTSEPVLCFLADKAGAGALNVHLYRIFADPFNTPTLLARPLTSEGFRFTVRDPRTGDSTVFDLPHELHPFLRAVSPAGRGVVSEVRSRATGEVAAVASSGPDPVMIVRCQDPFPTVGEALEAFAFPYAAGAGPLMPVSTTDETPSRSDGPPRVVGLGFQVTQDRLVGPRDLLGDRAFEDVRRQALVAADYLRRHGPFGPAPLAASGERDPVPRV